MCFERIRNLFPGPHFDHSLFLNESAVIIPSEVVAKLVGLQPTVIASRAPHLLLEQSVMTKNRGRASPVNC